MPKTWLGIMAITIVINTIFVISLLAGLNGEQRAIFLFAAVALGGGLLFTIRTMQGLDGR
jgi:hypothetical protein